MHHHGERDTASARQGMAAGGFNDYPPDARHADPVDYNATFTGAGNVNGPDRSAPLLRCWGLRRQLFLKVGR